MYKIIPLVEIKYKYSIIDRYIEKSIQFFRQHQTKYGLTDEEINQQKQLIEQVNLQINKYFDQKLLKPMIAPELYYKQGLYYIQLNKFNEAIDMFNKAIDIACQQADYYFQKGVALGKLNLIDEELKMYDQAISIDNKHVNSYINKGTVLMNLNKLSEAIKFMTQFRKLTPTI